MSWKTFNRVLFAVSLLALAGPVLFLCIYWRYMPDSIPTHFNAAGQIDDWGHKSTVLLLPIVAVVVFCMLQFVAFLCASMKGIGSNRPMRAMETMCRLLNVVTALFFAYMTVCSALAAPLGRWAMAAFIGGMAVVIVTCILRACIPCRK